MNFDEFVENRVSWIIHSAWLSSVWPQWKLGVNLMCVCVCVCTWGSSQVSCAAWEPPPPHTALRSASPAPPSPPWPCLSRPPAQKQPQGQWTKTRSASRLRGRSLACDITVCRMRYGAWAHPKHNNTEHRITLRPLQNYSWDRISQHVISMGVSPAGWFFFCLWLLIRNMIRVLKVIIITCLSPIWTLPVKIFLTQHTTQST